MADRNGSSSVEKLVEPPGSIFRWQSLRPIKRDMLPFMEPIHGDDMDVELISGSRIRVFRADDGVSYFCHGLTFGGKEAPGGPVSPYSGDAVKTILEDLFVLVLPETASVESDIVVWHNADRNPIHSAILLKPVVAADTDRLDYATVLRSKNGITPEADVTLESLVDDEKSYGESYRVYRRR